MNKQRYTITINPLGCLLWLAIAVLIVKACGL